MKLFLQMSILLAAAAPLAAGAQIVSASKLLGAAVVTNAVEDAGYEDEDAYVTDLAIDLTSSEVRYAIVYTGSTDHTTGEAVYGVPLQWLRPGAQRDHLVLERGAPPPPPEESARMARASELIGKDVAGSFGEDLGEIRDLAVDLASGRVRYALFESEDGALERMPLAAFDFPPLGGAATLR